MDFLGQILWIAIFATLILTIPLAWKLMHTKKIYRLIVGLIFALILSFILYLTSLDVIFRDGMGPS